MLPVCQVELLAGWEVVLQMPVLKKEFSIAISMPLHQQTVAIIMAVTFQVQNLLRSRYLKLQLRRM